MRVVLFVMGNRRCGVEVESNPNIVLYNEEREESCLLKTFILHFTFEIIQTHGNNQTSYYSLESHEYSIHIYYYYYYYYKFPYTLPSFFPCQEISWKFLASTVCFSLFRMNCTVCCRPIQDFAFGSCDHKDLCANCMLHWLMLYKETTCPTCRVTLLPRYYD